MNSDQWFRRRCHLKDFLSRVIAALVFGGAEPFMQFVEGIMGNLHVKLFLIWGGDDF